MPTQVITVNGQSDRFKSCFENIPSEKIIFVSDRKDLQKTLELRNQTALEKKIPTEVKVLEEDFELACEFLKSCGDAEVFLLGNARLNCFLTSAAFFLGLKLFYFDGDRAKQIPTPRAKLQELFTETHLKIVKLIPEGGITHQDLSKNLGLSETLVHYYLYGKGDVKGLVNYGLVQENREILILTPLGRMLQ